MPRSGPRVRVPSRALKNRGYPFGYPLFFIAPLNETGRPIRICVANQDVSLAPVSRSRDVTRVPSRAFPTRNFLFSLFHVSAFLFRDTQFLAFSFSRVHTSFFPTRNFSFSLFHVSAFLFRDTQFLIFSFSRVCLLFFPTRNFLFSSFCVSTLFFSDT